MKRIVIPFACLAMTFCAAIAIAEEATDVDKGFEAYGKFMAGGVWTSTDDKGNKLVHEYRWVLDKKFIQLRTVKDDNPSIATIGVDPESGKMTWWGFSFSDARGKSVAKVQFDSVSEDSWSAQGKVVGDQAIEGKWRITKVDDDTLTSESEIKIDGVPQAPKSVTWKRRAK